MASAYDAFVIGEDDRLHDVLFGEYQGLQLRYTPRISRVSSAQEALDRLAETSFDLIIAMSRVGAMPLDKFAEEVKRRSPDTSVALLAYSAADLNRLQPKELHGVNRAYLWNGNVRILLAMIKQVEDARNIEHDVLEGGVQVVLLVEDSVRFYSYYLPQLYTEILLQTGSLIEEGINLRHRMLRMRARPKVVLASDYETALTMFERYQNRLLGVITDIQFPKDGELTPDAGLRLIRQIRAAAPDMPILLQSSNRNAAAAAKALDCSFLAKGDPGLADGFRGFLREHMGFGAFVFRTEDGTEVARASDLAELVDSLPAVDDKSIDYHAGRNHFSKWLLARTEFELAHMIRPRKVSEFSHPGDLKRFLIRALSETLEERYSGSVTEFTRLASKRRSAFMKIGEGSLGGKARGLGFLNSLLSRRRMRSPRDALRVEIPRSTVVATEIFEEFLTLNDLRPSYRGLMSDAELREAFDAARLPELAVEDLRILAERADYPFAVRSSASSEDAQFQPTAGLYETYFLPNNDPDVEVRLDRLCRAVRMVFASTFTERARNRRASLQRGISEEKMAVLIQRLVGRVHGERFYPSVSGVMQSRNYYPVPPLKSEDGVVYAALGLGSTVVDGGCCHAFSPARPSAPLQSFSTKDWFRNAQREFLALDLSLRDFLPAGESRANLLSLPVSQAEEDGVLAPIASTYIQADDRLYEGIGRKGARLITFAPLLADTDHAFAETLGWLMELSEQAVGCPVELEFTFDPEARRLSVLQLRPMPSRSPGGEVSLDDIPGADLLLKTPRALGHGEITGVRNILFIPPEAFERSKTRAIAAELAKFNARLKSRSETTLLIGPGRWGSADPLLGIPVRWEDIDSAKAIVETTHEGFVVEPSLGTHFLHNVVSLGVGYLTIRHRGDESFLDWDWLRALKTVDQSEHVRWARFEEPLKIYIDGSIGAGVVLKT
ncbi:MAG: histidine kinase [Elusimicrobia bacterium CG_4_9_14_3_um_filter_62_55]|nr:MAG: histidine kinase [Elusimicrobia bacterium CG22_combo_CG10-13_8_21_14_all_63_91]PJA15674.1 MAG: histidine kinase [Elusimicrobia bacterium CG_4_10_14_0_2_um_filter_63_34]PJB23690.1 MAG: histidine kinase [Elusimicrobia bacterium CG_4_9_14_3_um_filter_62_55]